MITTDFYARIIAAIIGSVIGIIIGKCITHGIFGCKHKWVSTNNLGVRSKLCMKCNEVRMTFPKKIQKYDN